MEAIKPEYIKSYINNTYPVGKLRKMVIFFLLFFVDFFMFPLIYASPYDPFYFYILIVPIVLIHLFGFWVAIDPYKHQVLAQLYLGVFGVLASFGYLVLTQKLVYSIMGLKSPFYAVITFSLYLIGYFALFRWHSNNLKSGYYERTKHQSKNVNLYAPIAGLGVFVGNVMLGIAHGNLKLGIGTGALLLLTAVFMMFSAGIHKYMLMKKYPQWVKLKSKGE